jgi:predicted phosphate transport protein (TIGR00153 family)
MPMFRTSRHIERQIDEFLDAVNEGALVFRDAIDAYLAGRVHDFQAKREVLENLETRADHLSHEVESLLYGQSLIPEHRGDVLGLLEHTDDIIDRAKTCLQRFDVEHPDIPEKWRDHYHRLAHTAYAAVEAVIMAARRFFRDPATVGDYLFKVHHYEGECDHIGLELRRGVFADPELDLARRQHLRYFAEAVDRVADMTEAVADRLAIYSIKRRL